MDLSKATMLRMFEQMTRIREFDERAALLMEQGHYAEAEEVYRTDLGLNNKVQRCAQHRDNVWALHGLVECLQNRGETAECAALEKKLLNALEKTDLAITSSCFCRADVVTPSCC